MRRLGRGGRRAGPGPADLGLAASLGQTTLGVLRPLRVALFSTGDELREAGQPLDPGCVYDSNRYTLDAMLRRFEWTFPRSYQAPWRFASLPAPSDGLPLVLHPAVTAVCR